jgi:hypothetical protein
MKEDVSFLQKDIDNGQKDLKLKSQDLQEVKMIESQIE